MDEDRDQQTTEVRETNDTNGNTRVRRQTVRSTREVSGGVVLQRIVYYIAGVIIALLLIRLILLLLGANQGAPFVDFIYGVSGFFAWPFYGIFNYQPSYGHFTFEISTVVAIIVYGLIATGLAKLFTLTSNHPEV